MKTNTKKETKRMRLIWTRQQAVVTMSASLAVLALFVVLRTQLPFAPKFVAENHKVDTPLTLTFNQKLGEVPTNTIKISPAVVGTWQHEKSFLFGNDTISFTPRDHFTANTTYTVSLPEIERVIMGHTNPEEIQFTTESAPGLTNSGLQSLADKETPVIPADYNFTATLRSPNRGLRTLELRTTPHVAATSSVAEDTTYTWKPTELLPQGEPITVELYDTKNKVSLFKKTVTVAKEPVPQPQQKTTDYLAGDSVIISFTEPITSTTGEPVTTSIPGKGEWQSDTSYRFTPQKLMPGTTYTYTVKKGLRSKQGGVLREDVTQTITARGAVNITAASPQGRELGQARQQLRITFNQPVDKASAASKLRLSRGTLGAVQWQGNTLIADITNIGYQQTVTVTIDAGVRNTGFGLPSGAPFSFSFTTEYRRVNLAMPFYGQQYAGSCTAASLRMIMASKGIHADDRQIVERMGYNPRPYNPDTDTWDDPQQMFVGKIDGSIREKTGAGPDAPPVAKAARSYGLNASAVQGINAVWVAQQLYAGKAVIAFGAFGGSNDYITWKTPTGDTAKMHITGHARTVTGVVGEPDNPIGFWVNDPLRGKQYWSAGQLAADIARDPYRQAVAVW